MSSPTAAAAAPETFTIVRGFYASSATDEVLSTDEKLPKVFSNLKIKRAFRISLICIFVDVT